MGISPRSLVIEKYSVKANKQTDCLMMRSLASIQDGHVTVGRTDGRTVLRATKPCYADMG